MNENINLCELLKGHEGETFYTTLYSNCELDKVNNDGTISILNRNYSAYFDLEKDGKLCTEGECVIFPSKDQRDWNKWAEEQKPKVPKTWSELKNNKAVMSLAVCTHSNIGQYTNCETPIEKAALALLKIHQLIKVGYGGNITNEEWEDIDIEKYEITCTILDSNLDISIDNTDIVGHIVFHTHKQAEEFLSYPENVQLIRDLFQIQ